jgi:HipA-like protein
MNDEGPRTVIATRYVTPLREGGSLPAIVEADDDGLYVVKFRGAGQGPKTLIAELLAGEIGRSLGLPVPDIVFVELDAALSKAEPDPEIQDLLRSSAGLNIGLDFLPGSLAYVPAAQPSIDPGFAAATVWFDAYVMNVDRTPRNPNLLTWHGRPWLIDHGAALYVHHVADDILPRAADRFPQIADHILLPYAAPIGEMSAALAALLPGSEIERIVWALPADWITASRMGEPDGVRNRYVEFLCRRLEGRSAFEEEAERARTRTV